jgi:hypothetical protein
MRQAVRELASETRLYVTDNLDDPSDSWIELRTPWFKLSEDKTSGVRHDRQVRLTVEVEDGPARYEIEQLKDELRQKLTRLRNFQP